MAGYFDKRVEGDAALGGTRYERASIGYAKMRSPTSCRMLTTLIATNERKELIGAFQIRFIADCLYDDVPSRWKNTCNRGVANCRYPHPQALSQFTPPNSITYVRNVGHAGKLVQLIWIVKTQITEIHIFCNSDKPSACTYSIKNALR